MAFSSYFIAKNLLARPIKDEKPERRFVQCGFKLTSERKRKIQRKKKRWRAKEVLEVAASTGVQICRAKRQSFVTLSLGGPLLCSLAVDGVDDPPTLRLSFFFFSPRSSPARSRVFFGRATSCGKRRHKLTPLT